MTARALRHAVRIGGVAALLAFAAPLAHAQDCVPGTDLLAELAPEAAAAIRAEAALVPNGEGRLFRIERDGVAPSHLFGTMHLSDPRVVELPAQAQGAFASAEQLVVETLDLADEALIAAAVLGRPELTTLPAGTDLLDLVAAEDRPAVADELEAHGMPAGSVRSLQPWFVTVALVTPACESERQREGAEVLDLSLLTRARDGGKALLGLETAIEQMEALASMPLDLQAENLVATVELLERLPDIFETMIVLYTQGRIAEITTAIENIAPAGTDEDAASAVYAAFEERIVTQRNHTMAGRLEPMLSRGAAFVAVGALHLPGEEGLVELLRGEGWRVTRAD